jgi:hypothetical protein
MAERNLNGVGVAILTTDGFEEVELVEPRMVLGQRRSKNNRYRA